jgi:hypothetical protein
MTVSHHQVGRLVVELLAGRTMLPFWVIPTLAWFL